MNRIRPAAVIFDYGNVLSAPQGRSEIQAMARILNSTVDAFRAAYWKFRAAYDEAKLDPIAYWNHVAAEMTCDLPASQIPALLEIDGRSWAYPARNVPQWARHLREAGIKTALLSNMPISVRQYIERCDWLPPFDYRTFSGDLGIAKPAPEIYHHCITGLRLDPDRILFLDDRPENVRAAETLGLHGIVYTTAEQAAEELRQRFDIPVSLVATVEYGNEKDQ